MRLSGGLNLVHKRRPGYVSFARQIFGSGMGRAQMCVLYPAGFSLFTALPGLALAAAAAGLFWSPLPTGAAALAYLAACAFFSVTAAGQAPLAAPVALTLFPVVHLAYAAGWWTGLLGAAADKALGTKARRCVCGKEIV